MELHERTLKVSLRRLVEADKNSLAALANNKKIWDNLRDYFPHPYTLKDAEDFIALTAREEPPVTFGIFREEAFAGVVGLVKKDDVYRKTAEIGYWLGEPFWGRGVTTAAVGLMVDYGFNKLKLERIDAGIFEYNIASQKVLEKCGFALEGVYKNAIFKNEQLLHEIRFGITKQEYQRR